MVGRRDHPQQRAVDQQADEGQEQEGDEPVHGGQQHGPPVVHQQREHGHGPLLVHHAGLGDLLPEGVDELLRQPRPDLGGREAQHPRRRHPKAAPEDRPAKARPQKCPQQGGLLSRPAHTVSFSSPSPRRRRHSSRPRIRQISTAPPGVTALPAAAMRTGHIRVAFFTSSRAARSVRQA